MKTVIIVQARMTSTRLPGKVLKEVLGRPLLEYQIERLRRADRADQIVIATTTNDTDEPIMAFCRDHDVAAHRGSENDVLARYHGAALQYQADIVVRVTSDCPLIDPVVLDQVVGHLQAHPELDYVSNVLERSYPRGLDCEAFRFNALDAAFGEAKSLPEREHVTPFIWGRPERFKLAGIRNPVDLSRHRWTVDTEEDFRLIRNMLEALYPVHPDFLLEDCLDVLSIHPDWPLINAEIEQKKTI